MKTMSIRPSRRERHGDAITVAVAAVVGLVAALVLVVPASPRFVEEITVVNPTPFPLVIYVGGADPSPVTTLGHVEARDSATFRLVRDQGAAWLFHIRSGGVAARAVAVPRQELAATQWRFDVPEDVEAELRASGRIPPEEYLSDAPLS
jgi:hypothetical protein